MNSFKQYMAEDRRITILRVLLESAAYTANHFLLSDALDSFGHKISYDQLRTDLAWLQEQGVLTVKVLGDVHIATLTQRGQDVAQGRAIVPGIKRPSAL